MSKEFVVTLETAEAYWDFMNLPMWTALYVGSVDFLDEALDPFATVKGRGFDEAWFMADGMLVHFDYTTGLVEGYTYTEDMLLAGLDAVFKGAA